MLSIKARLKNKQYISKINDFKKINFVGNRKISKTSTIHYVTFGRADGFEIHNMKKPQGFY